MRNFHPSRSAQIALISAYRPERSLQENGNASYALAEQLRAAGLQFDVCRGFWEGKEEQSFAVDLGEAGNSGEVYAKCEALGRQYQQDAIGHVDGQGLFYVDWLQDTRDELIGVWRELPEGAALPQGYTVFPNGRTYYAEPIKGA